MHEKQKELILQLQFRKNIQVISSLDICLNLFGQKWIYNYQVMKSNQHTYRILLLLTIFVISLQTFPRKNRTRLQYTYVDYLNQNFCPSKIAIQESEQLSAFREQRKQNNLIQISIDQIVEGNIMGSVTIRPQFVLTLFAFAVCFISLFILLRRLNKYNNMAIKSGIKMSEQLVMKGTNRKNVIFKGLILVLLLVSVFYAIHGLKVASEVEKGVQKLLCGLINIPNNFARADQDKTSKLDNYTTYNDYQYQVMSLRQLFNEAKFNLTNILKKNKQQNFLAQTHKISQILKTSQHQKFINSILHTAQLAESLRNQSKFMGASLNYLREVLYWIKGGLVFAQSFLNSYYSIEKIPQLTSSLIIQTYQILLLCSLGVCSLIVFMSLKSTSKQGQIVKYIILILPFCTLLCLSFSSLGTSLIPVPKQICNILAENPNKAALVSKVTANVKFYQESVRSTLLQLLERISDKSDGNMAFADPEIYQNMQKLKKQFTILSQYDLKDVQAKLASKQPGFEQDIKKYFTYFPKFLQDIKQVINIFDQIKLSILKQGDFGRLTLRPFGEYIQLLESNLCDVNLHFWQKNTKNLFNYGVISLLIMLFLALYLRNKLKGDYLSANQQQNFEMSAYSVERMSDV